MDLTSRRTIFVTGKGGVGKTSTAAAVAELYRRQGKRVLLVEIDHAAPSLGRLFDVESHSTPSPVGPRFPNLFLCNLDWHESLEAYLNESLPGTRAAKAIMNFKVTRSLLEALPLGRESVMLRTLVRMHTEGKDRFDIMVVDLPASGHAVALFSTARTLQRVFNVGTTLRTQAEEIEALFGGEESGLLLTAIPEEMSVTETIETAGVFAELSFPPLLGVLLNRFPSDAPETRLRPQLEQLEQKGGSERMNEAVTSALTELRHRERAEKACKRLNDALGKTASVPMIRAAKLDLVVAMADRLEVIFAGEPS